MRRQADHAKSTAGAVCQAKIMRADGSVEFRYSTSSHHWWNVKARRWVRRRILAMKREEA